MPSIHELPLFAEDLAKDDNWPSYIGQMIDAEFVWVAKNKAPARASDGIGTVLHDGNTVVGFGRCGVGKSGSTFCRVFSSLDS